jgi:hypothetical protein
MAGGAQYAWNQSEWWPWHTLLFGAAVTGVSGAFGLVESVWWICTGVGDTLSGGYFELTPEAALNCSLQPELSAAIAGPAPAQTEDHCGRPLAATK